MIADAEQVLLRFHFYRYRKLSKALTCQGHTVGEHFARRLLQQ